MSKEIEINFDQVALLGPLMAGQILNAYFTALLLKQQRGIEITREVEHQTRNEVFAEWSDIQDMIESAPRDTKRVRLETSENL